MVRLPLWWNVESVRERRKWWRAGLEWRFGGNGERRRETQFGCHFSKETAEFSLLAHALTITCMPLVLDNGFGGTHILLYIKEYLDIYLPYLPTCETRGTQVNYFFSLRFYGLEPNRWKICILNIKGCFLLRQPDSKIK